MDAIDIDKLRGELGIAGFAKRLAEDAELRAAFELHRQRQDAAAPTQGEARLTPQLWRVSADGYGFAVVSVPVGRPHRVRAVGDLVEVRRHWGNAGGALCFEANCKHCPSERRREGYFDGIFARKTAALEVELFRAIASVPAAALEMIEGRPLRGMKLEFFRKTDKSRTQVAILEEECDYELPPAIDVRLPLARLWQLPYWPNGVVEEDEPRTILKFRKQA